MARLTENDWNFINDLIFKIHSISDLKEMRYTFLELIQDLIPCDKLTFFLSAEDHHMYDPVQIGLQEDRTKAYQENLWKQDYKKWIFMTNQCKAYRMTDLFSSGERESQEYYKIAYIPYQIHYEAILSLSFENCFVGVVSLYRPRGMADFSDREIYILELFKQHLAFRLYRDMYIEQGFASDRKIRKLNEFAAKYHLTPRESEISRMLYEGEKKSGNL